MYDLLKFVSTHPVHPDRPETQKFRQTIIDAFPDLTLEVHGDRGKFPLFNAYFGAARKFIMELALSGYRKDDLSVVLVNHNTITVSSRDGRGIPPASPIQQIFIRTFTTSFRFNRDIDIFSVEYEDGLLKIMIDISDGEELRKSIPIA